MVILESENTFDKIFIQNENQPQKQSVMVNFLFPYAIKESLDMQVSFCGSFEFLMLALNFTPEEFS